MSLEIKEILVEDINEVVGSAMISPVVNVIFEA